MSHPSRAARLPALIDALAPLPCVVAVDPRPRNVGNRQVAALAWSLAPGDHHAVVQDDALPVPGFAASATAACRCAGDAAVAFWMRGSHREARRVRRQPLGVLVEIGLRDWPPTVALAMPHNHALTFSRLADERAGRYDDEVLAMFLQETGTRLLVCQPSIVEHDHTEPSLFQFGRSDPPRRAAVIADVAPVAWTVE